MQWATVTLILMQNADKREDEEEEEEQGEGTYCICVVNVYIEVVAFEGFDRDLHRCLSYPCARP